MTLERKEIEYWLSINEEPPFIKECGIDWNALVSEYNEMVEKEKNALFQEENEKYLKIINSLTKSDVEEFEEEGVIPSSLNNIVTLDSNMRFKFIKIPDMSPSTGGYVFDDISIKDTSEEEYEKYIETYSE